jgi:cobalt/nickel transport protein
VKAVSTKWVALGILVVALLLAGVVSYYASSEPDGLNRVAQDTGISRTE